MQITQLAQKTIKISFPFHQFVTHLLVLEAMPKKARAHAILVVKSHSIMS
jgi:hypothetical protein